MSPEERDRLVAAFIERFTREYVWDDDKVLREVKGEREDNLWAFEAFNDIACADPDLCWQLILQTLHTPHAESVDEVLAAGPLEDLLAKFGPLVIDRVELKAAEDPKFKSLLGGVWQNTMSLEIWHRVEACREEVW